jgi:hypothetical protein
MGRKTGKIKFLKDFNSSKLIIPSFQYSNWGEAPKFLPQLNRLTGRVTPLAG